MSVLEELKAELCPDGVEYKRLGDIAEIRSGAGFSRWEQGLLEGDLPFFKVKDMNHPQNTSYMMVAENYISYETSQKLKCNPAPKDTVIFPKIGMSIATNKVRMLSCEACYDNNIMGVIAGEQISARFLYHIFSSYNMMKFAEGKGAVPSIRKSIIEAILIPVPPLEVQDEIVRILDNFSLRITELTACLTRELDLRKQQYEYYRDKLLCLRNLRSGGMDNTNTSGIVWVKLSDIATITRGGSFQKKHFTPEGKPCIHYGQIHTYYGVHTSKTLSRISPEMFSKSRTAQPGDIIMATTSEDVEGVCKCTAWLGDEPVAVSGHTAIIHHSQNPKYLAYFFQSETFQIQKRHLAYGTKVIEVKPSTLGDVLVPLPPLNEQERIAQILDRFDSLCNNLSHGLPAEIQARHIQYQYYRDKLLTFKEKSSCQPSAQSQNLT